MISLRDIKFLYQENHTRFYSLRMPITDAEQTCEINGDLPQGALIDYVISMTKTMACARDYQAFNDDLRPLVREERQKFGVKIGLVNPCFPVRKARVRNSDDV